MEKINKVQQSRLSVERAYYRLLKSCRNFDNLSLFSFANCYNSIYTLDDDNEELLGIIACRWTTESLREHEISSFIKSKFNHRFMKYFMGFCSQKNKIYKIEVLHFSQKASDQSKKNLILACVEDKNDSFVVLKPTCVQVIQDASLLKEIGFIENIIDEDTFLIKPPEKIALILDILKKDK